MHDRAIDLPQPGEETFMLWGPRRVGKSVLLEQRYPKARNHWVDLLQSQFFKRYSADPTQLRKELEANPPPLDTQVVIDEIQEVPRLLREVHWMIENRGYKFAMCGSSPRKIIRKGGNLLGGRAFRYELRGITSHELGSDFDLKRILNVGYLPSVYESKNPQQELNAHVEYLKSEVTQEGLLRDLVPFRNFLEAAALRDGSTVSNTNIASESNVSAKTVRNYFEILEETLLVQWLPVYQKIPKSREVQPPKFYFSDIGAVNFLAKRGELLAGGSSDFGKAFENWVFHELSTYLAYNNPPMRQTNRLSYWGQHNGPEVDFLVGDWLAIEVKSSENIRDSHLKGLYALRKKYPSFETLVVVSRVPRALKRDDGILVLPYMDFAKRLWDGELIPI